MPTVDGAVSVAYGSGTYGPDTGIGVGFDVLQPLQPPEPLISTLLAAARAFGVTAIAFELVESTAAVPATLSCPLPDVCSVFVPPVARVRSLTSARFETVTVMDADVDDVLPARSLVDPVTVVTPG